MEWPQTKGYQNLIKSVFEISIFDLCAIRTESLRISNYTPPSKSSFTLRYLYMLYSDTRSFGVTDTA